MPAAEAPDIALHATLLIGALDAREAERALEPVVRAQRHEPIRLDPPPALQHTHDPPTSNCRSAGRRIRRHATPARGRGPPGTPAASHPGTPSRTRRPSSTRASG